MRCEYCGWATAVAALGVGLGAVWLGSPRHLCDDVWVEVHEVREYGWATAVAALGVVLGAVWLGSPRHL